ncbi:helix-turn-helix domain-containing protein [Arthrobacter sp. EpRS71]|uniref:helix-turn-helix domain-containing protein n=1 Tax=Arthrobacter sp. EpRS71 TaxID=1743141 RepID=UPI00074641B8|nr:helix-turn-helix domain-containing protein [Arthrobacter sp. EpRS71]KUM38984.1 hypothetical protein AR689_07470 [Arthrobacter sp. EpRS71]
MSESLTQTSRLLKLLKTKGSATNRELNRICFRYGARIHDLRHEGYEIVSEHIKDGLWRFTYKGHRDDQEKAA